MSGASERANGRASSPVLHSVFLVILAHSALGKGGFCGEKQEADEEIDLKGAEEQLETLWTSRSFRPSLLL